LAQKRASADGKALPHLMQNRADAAAALCAVAGAPSAAAGASAAGAACAGAAGGDDMVGTGSVG
jgi:hypothetical protein